MKLNIIYELTLSLDGNRFQNIFNKAYRRSDSTNNGDDESLDHSMADKGIIVRYRDSTYKKKVTMVVNSSVLIRSDKPDSERVIRKMNKCISGYFGGECSLDDFYLSGISVITDINVGSRDNVSAYIKVLKRIGKVKGFSPAEYDEIDSGFCLAGNSNGLEFLIYDLERQSEGCFSDGRSKQFKGILRTEVKLNRKALSTFIKEQLTSHRIFELTKQAEDIFMGTFTKVVPFGDCLKKGDADEVIRKKIDNPKLRRRMLRLVELIPEKKSLMLAQKAMNYRKVDELMEEFAKLNLSPVTISKRSDVKLLESLYSYFL